MQAKICERGAHERKDVEKKLEAYESSAPPPSLDRCTAQLQPELRTLRIALDHARAAGRGLRDTAHDRPLRRGPGARPGSTLAQSVSAGFGQETQHLHGRRRAAAGRWARQRAGDARGFATKAGYGVGGVVGAGGAAGDPVGVPWWMEGALLGGDRDGERLSDHRSWRVCEAGDGE